MDVLQTFCSTIHAGYASVNSFNYLMNTLNFVDYKYSLNISSIYFIFDLVYLFNNRNNKTNREMIYHHIIAISCVQMNLLNPENVSVNTIALLFLSELSTIPLNICWILNKKNKVDNILFKLSGISTLLLYIPCRILLFPYCSYIAFTNNYNIQGVLLLSYTGLNILWYRKLLNKFLNI